jgi:nucleoside-diphosphate-sugar epimerase
LASLEIEIVRGDVTDLKSLESAFVGADIVFHLAGIVTIMPSMKKLLERVNVGGVRNVAHGLILAAEKGQSGRHYIFSGAQVQVPELMKELERNIGYPAPTYEIPSTIARAAGQGCV